MYIDQIGNVQYKALSGDYISSTAPTPNDPGWLKELYGDDAESLGSQYEFAYNKDVFNLDSAKYNSFKTFFPLDYTYLNEDSADVFYTTKRSTWIN